VSKKEMAELTLGLGSAGEVLVRAWILQRAWGLNEREARTEYENLERMSISAELRRVLGSCIGWWMWMARARGWIEVECISSKLPI